MKNCIYFLLLLLFFSCTKNTFDAPIDYTKLIGTWESINSDEKIYIEFSKKGIIKAEFEIQRSFKIKSIKGTKNESIKSFYFETNSLKTNFGISYNETIDTLSKFYRFFNQEEYNIDQSVYFTKIK